jgi:hypothetical protein
LAVRINNSYTNAPIITAADLGINRPGLPFSIMDSNAGSAYAALPALPPIAITATLARGDCIRLCRRRYRFAHQRVFEHCCFQAAPVIGDDGTATSFGTLGRNTYRGPFEQNWNLSIIQEFLAHRAPEDSFCSRPS